MVVRKPQMVEGGTGDGDGSRWPSGIDDRAEESPPEPIRPTADSRQPTGS